MILVVDAAELMGSEICRRLVASGKSVRGLVRANSVLENVHYLKILGVEIVQADLQNPVNLYSACQGVRAVIFTTSVMLSLQPEEFTASSSIKSLLNLVTAAGDSGVNQFILCSALIPSDESPIQLAWQSLENAVTSSGLSYTILRNAIFMENCLKPEFGFDYRQARAVIYGDGHKEISFISLPDAARCAVDCLENPLAKNKIFSISTGRDYSLLEIVWIFEQVGGKPFDLTFIPASALEAQRAAARDPNQFLWCTFLVNLAKGIRIDSSQARAVFKFHLTSVDEYARQVLASYSFSQSIMSC